MSSINSVNGNVAELSKQQAEKAEKAEELSKQKAEKAEEAAKKSAESVSKTDTVEISEKASALAGTAKVDNVSDATSQPQDVRDVIKAKKAEVKQLKSDLRDIGVSKKEVKHIMKRANRKANRSVRGDIREVSRDYRKDKIDKQELKNAMNVIAVKQLDGVISNVTNVYDRKMAFINNNNGSETQAPHESIFTKTANEPTLVEKSHDENKEKSEDAKAVAANEEKTKMEAKPAINAKPEITEKPAKAEKPVPAEKAEKPAKEESMSKLEKALKDILKEILKSENEAPGLTDKSEGPGNSENASEKIASMFNEIEKMVNELDEDVEEADEKSGFGEFVSGLKDMFGSGNGVEGNSFLKGLNKVTDEDSDSGAQIKAETLSGLLKGGSANSAFGVKRVGDNGEGSGNFTAVNFMSDMSNNASEGLDSYKDAKEAREAAANNQAQQAGAEAQLSEVA